MISRVTGTEDILDCSLQNFVISTLHKTFENAHFTPIQTPILEYTSLFVHSLGDQTDVVSKEMYVFAQDSEKSVCLRPESTASTIRACVENKIDRFPWKVFSCGPMFRRERPQKGRLRQFTQFNIEIINAPSIMHDAAFISLLDSTFRESFKLSNYLLKLNFLGCSTDRLAHKEALKTFLQAHSNQLCATCQTRAITNTLRVFDCKNEACKKLYTNAPLLLNHLCTECHEEWADLQNTLRMLAVNFVLEPMLVRGLDYYCKTVFEFCATSTLGSQNAFCGGGRYRLGAAAGAPTDFDSVGAAVGIERIIMLLAENQAQLNLPIQKALSVIIPVAEAQNVNGLLLMQELHKAGLPVDIILDKASMSNMFKKANRMNAGHVLVLGEQEQLDGTVSIKNMTTGHAVVIKQTDVVSYLK